MSISLLYNFCTFIIVSTFSNRLGNFLTKINLPLITGFMATGVLAGPYVLNLISKDTVTDLRILDEISLSFIAFAAGSELYLNDLKSRFKSIKWNTILLTVITFHVGGLAIFFLSEKVSFLASLPITSKIAISLLGGSILSARSPSSAIAIIKELRAKGPFTQTFLGVTVITDVIVIVLYSINASIADALEINIPFNLSFLMLLAVELIASISIGLALGQILKFMFSKNIPKYIKGAIFLALGLAIYQLTYFTKEYTLNNFSAEISLEPLLICMIASFYVANFTHHRLEIIDLVHIIGPTIYIAFFTLTGASFQIDVFQSVWKVSIILFALRLVSIFIGSFLGGIIAGDPPISNKVGWMGYVTQAGVGLGLAKEVSVHFPGWGPSFATLMISVIVMNQIIGPILFRTSLFLVKEAHPKAKKSDMGELHSAIIMGVDGTSMALAQQLSSHDWQVKIASHRPSDIDHVMGTDIQVVHISDLSLESLKEVGAAEVGTIVTMLSDENNLHICELAYEHFSNCKLVVYLKSRNNYSKFKEVGASIVTQSTATISLLDHFVRSPSAVSLLLGLEEGQDIIDLTITNPHLFGLPLRDLRLPNDILIVSLHRGRHNLIVQGHTRFKVGDQLTVKGPPDSLREVISIFTS